jgi:ankyrin repeat protein
MKILIPIVICLLVVGCGPEPTIHEAAEDGDIKRVKQHLVKGVDVNAKFKDSWTPLHMAAEEGHKKVVELLILKGADINVKNGDDRTPLDDAIKHKNAEIADILRKHGAKVGEEMKVE